jgi:choline dehydrogenase
MYFYMARVHKFIDPSLSLLTSLQTPMRMPGALKLFKEALPLAFPGLTIGNDLSNRTSVVSAETSWTIWYDPATNLNRRSSAADGLLWAADQQRDCLTVLANHKVDRVLFDKDLTAKGIVFGANSSSELATVYAKKEVILSTGSLASAPILERSGIGKQSVLEAVGIQQLVDLPGVGTNLNDQPGTTTTALVAEAYQNDTSIIDGGGVFAPEISLVNVDEIWGPSKSTSLMNFWSQDSQSGTQARLPTLIISLRPRHCYPAQNHS